MLCGVTLRCFVGQVVPRSPPSPPPQLARNAWHHGVARHGATLWQRVAAVQWPWQKPKPEPHLLQPLHDLVNGFWWQLELLWQATGLGPWLGLFWSALVPYPPFSWLQWAALKVWHLPRLYRFWIIYVFADNVWKWLLPSLHEEVMSGIFLALLHRYNPKGYVDRVVNRFVSLLNKQAKLLSPKGVRAPLPEELLETLCIRLRNDGELLEALGHRRILRIWPRLRRKTLGTLSFPSASDEAWVHKTIVDGYYREVEVVVKEAALVAAAQEAAARMRVLHEAMDSAKLASKDGGLSQGTGGLMSQVDTASAQAADAIIALGQAKVEAQEAAARVGKVLGKTWQDKMDELMDVHKALPDVVAELQRLDPSKESPKTSSRDTKGKGKKPRK